MPLSSRVKNKIIDAVNLTFSSIGATPDTRPAKTRDNAGPILWEYFIAWHLNTRAKSRLDSAKAECIKAGVMFDPEKHPREPSDGGLITTGEYVGVFLTVKNPSTRINTDTLRNALLDAGVKEAVIDKAYAAAEYKTRPPHEFKPVLVINDNPTNGK